MEERCTHCQQVDRHLSWCPTQRPRFAAEARALGAQLADLCAAEPLDWKAIHAATQRLACVASAEAALGEFQARGH